MPPKVSVVIPAFNRAGYLRTALESVFRQTFSDYEVLMVDDGSTDKTRQTVESFGPRVRYFYQENQGRSQARNTGLRQARGEIIAFLDSDDAWFPDKLERQIRYFDENPETHFLHGHVEVMNEKGNFLEKQTSQTQSLWSRAHKRGVDYAAWSLECRCLLSTVAVRAACLKEAGEFDPAIPANEELDLYLRIAQKRRIHFLEGRPLTRYRLHSGNSGNDNLSKGGILTARKHLAMLETDSGIPDRGRANRNLRLFLSRNHFMLGQNAEGRKAFAEAVLRNPSGLFISPHLRLFLASFIPKAVRAKLKSFGKPQTQNS